MKIHKYNRRSIVRENMEFELDNKTYTVDTHTDKENPLFRMNAMTMYIMVKPWLIKACVINPEYMENSTEDIKHYLVLCSSVWVLIPKQKGEELLKQMNSV